MDVLCRRSTKVVLTCFACGFTAGLLLVWVVRVEVRAQLRDQQPTIETTTWYAPVAPVFASEDGLVLNFVRPERAADFEAVMAKVGAALRTNAVLRGYLSLKGWQILRAPERARDGSIVYVFTAAETRHGENYDLLLALSRAFPSEGISLYGRYAGACTANQKVVKVTPVATLGWAPRGQLEAAVSTFATAP